MATGQYIGVNGVARKVVSTYVGVDGVSRNVKNGYVGVNGVARLFFAPDDGGPIILEVEKITSDTYANETTYTAEEFILLDIYPKTNGTVKVTYGGLTKTITDTSGAEEPNAQKVFFGAFNGVSDEVETPASGELTIKGDCAAVGQGKYTEQSNKDNGKACFCVKKIVSLGAVTNIYTAAFGNPNDTTIELVIPDTVISIGAIAFGNMATENIIIEGSPSIGSNAFKYCSFLRTVELLSATPPELLSGNAGGEYCNFGDITSDTCVLEQIIVPKGCGNAYKTAEGWSAYADYIVEAT